MRKIFFLLAFLLSQGVLSTEPKDKDEKIVKCVMDSGDVAYKKDFDSTTWKLIVADCKRANDCTCVIN